MVPVATNHALDIVHRQIFPAGIADVLPTGNLFQYQQSVFIASVKKVRRLRIVRCANDIAVEIFAQNPGVAALDASRHRLANKRKGLMAIQSAELQMLTVEKETFGCEARLAKADARIPTVDEAIAIRQSHADLV